MTQRLAGAAALALIGTIVVFILAGWSISLAPLGVLLGFWVAFGAMAELIDRAKLGRIAPIESWRRLAGPAAQRLVDRDRPFRRRRQRHRHRCDLGVGGRADHDACRPGKPRRSPATRVHFDGVDDAPGPNYSAAAGRLHADGAGWRARARSSAEKRVYTVSQQPTTRSLDQYLRLLAALSAAWREGAGQRLCRPHLVQAVRYLHLARRDASWRSPASCRSPTGGCASARRARSERYPDAVPEAAE